MYDSPFDVYTNSNLLRYVLTTAKLNATRLRLVADLANFKFKIHYRSGIKNKSADYLSWHPLLEIEQIQKDSDMVTNSDNIGYVITITSTHNNPHIDINVLQLNLVDNITSVRTEQLIESQFHDDYVKPVYQFVKTKIKPSKQQWKDISYKSKLLMKQYHKSKLGKNVLIRSTSEYNQIVQMRNLGTEKVVDLARQRFYWPRMYKDIDTYIRKKCQCVKQK